MAEELKNKNCLNIQEKFAETNTWFKFISFGSELYFASEFANLGFKVSFIPDNSSEWKRENGWTYFLEKVGFNPQSNAHIREPGILINEPIFNNVTGVITRMQDHLQVVPNPFAENKINYLNLEKIVPWRTVEDIYNRSLGYSGLDYLKSN